MIKLINISPEHAEVVAETRNNVRKYLIDQKIIKKKDAEEYLCECIKNGDKFWGIESHGCIVGYIDWHTKKKEIGIKIKLNETSKGIGTKALAIALEKIKKEYSGNIYANVLKWNKRSLNLFLKMGFIIFEDDENIIYLKL